MNRDEYEWLLFDRLEAIKSANFKYDLENNAYLSFSGGKDSTLLHYLIDKALPNNNIPRVYINTGIEYSDIVAFVKELAEKDDRFVILSPRVPIKPMLEKYGYPFKSKEHSKKCDQYWRTGVITDYLDKYINPKSPTRYKCPKQLLYQFTKENNLHCSHLCCQKLKKEPIKIWAKLNKRSIAITGLRGQEGGQRANIKGCILTDSKGKVILFHPLIKINEEWEDEFIKDQSIKLCKLYYEPFNFKRTGCKGCPFALTLQEQLDKMGELLPNERKQCEVIWKPVYDEYRRLNYRLNKQMSIFDK